MQAYNSAFQDKIVSFLLKLNIVTQEEGLQQWAVVRNCFAAMVSPYLLCEDFLCAKGIY